MEVKLICHVAGVSEQSTADARKIEDKGDAEFETKINSFLKSQNIGNKGKKKYEIEYRPISLMKRSNTVAVKHCALITIY